MTNEVRTVDPDTGAEKGVKLERFDLVPAGPDRELARHYGMGAAKYADRNWELGYDWSKSYGAVRRHLSQFWAGEDLDPDPFYDQFNPAHRPKHVIAAAWHCFALAQFMDQHREKDNRPKLYVPKAGGWESHPVDTTGSTTVWDEVEAEKAERAAMVEFVKWATSKEYDPMIDQDPAKLVQAYYEREL